MTGQNVLVVEDEAKIARLICDYLEQAGYKATALERGDQVIPHIKRAMPDLILLDLMLPGLDGMEVCRKIRKFSSVPIIMITARVEEVDRLIGLELGADDYICKPFSPREVVARVRAVLRRLQPEFTEKILAVGPIRLDERTRLVTVNDIELSLTPSEFGLLKTMMTSPNKVFSRNELIHNTQGYAYEGYDRTIDTHIKNLRRKIGEALPDREIIVTVYGVGYKLSD